MGIAKICALFGVISSFGLLSQVPDASEKDLPTVVKFVAPPYPRSAKKQRIMGKTRTRLTINREGMVTEAKTILAHRVFEAEVLKALKQWRFKPADHEYTIEVICVFEYTECEGAIPETHVSAELPTTVHISTDLCTVDQQRNSS